MSSIDEIRGLRIKKLELLKARGMNPYPAESKRELSLQEAIDTFDNLEKSAENKWIAGRIMSIRGQGAIIFITLNDGTALFQGLLKKDVMGDDKFDFFNEVVDIGDFVEIHGNFFTTKRGEKTLEIYNEIGINLYKLFIFLRNSIFSKINKFKYPIYKLKEEDRNKEVDKKDKKKNKNRRKNKKIEKK